MSSIQQGKIDSVWFLIKNIPFKKKQNLKHSDKKVYQN